MTEKQKKVLQYLAERPDLKQYQVDIKISTDISRHTIAKILTVLSAQGLVVKYKRGVSITQAGMNLAK